MQIRNRIAQVFKLRFHINLTYINKYDKCHILLQNVKVTLLTQIKV